MESAAYESGSFVLQNDVAIIIGNFKEHYFKVAAWGIASRECPVPKNWIPA